MIRLLLLTGLLLCVVSCRSHREVQASTSSYQSETITTDSTSSKSIDLSAAVSSERNIVLTGVNISYAIESDSITPTVVSVERIEICDTKNVDIQVHEEASDSTTHVEDRNISDSYVSHDTSSSASGWPLIDVFYAIYFTVCVFIGLYFVFKYRK